MNGRIFALACLIAVAASAVGQDTQAPTMSIDDLMITVITPATNTLWGIEDPQTDADWQVFVDAADTVIEAGQSMKQGGSGPDDAKWAAEPAWQAFADALISAGRDARDAAVKKDVEAMYTAGEVLYPPCEECHLQFHPGVKSQ